MPRPILPCAALLALCLGAGATQARADSTLERVRAAGTLACGVLTEPSDFTHDDRHGQMTDFGTDLCRAVGIAALGAKDKVSFVSIPDEADGFASLAAGKIDVLMGAAPSLFASQAHHLAFTRPAFLDAEGFLAPVAARSLEDLVGKTLCFIPSQAGNDALLAGLARREVKVSPFPFEEIGEMEAAFVGGRCDAMAGPLTQLAESRSALGSARRRYGLLPDRLTIDPMAPAVRADDAAWLAVVDYAVSALIEADADGVTHANVPTMAAGDDPAARRLLGTEGGVGAALGLAPDFAAREVTELGNYAEIYDRDLGAGSDLGIPRGPNAPADRGGALLAAPFR